MIIPAHTDLPEPTLIAVRPLAESKQKSNNNINAWRASTMYRLSYLSKTTGSFDKTAFDQIVASASRKNEAAGISGYISFMEPVIFQYLEGDDAAVLKLMDKIQNDPRHSVLTIVDLGDTDERLFTNQGLVGDISEHEISPVLADMLLGKDKFIYGDGQLKLLALNMVNAVASKQELLYEINNEEPSEQWHPANKQPLKNQSI